MRAIEFAGTICAGKMSLLEGVRRELSPTYAVEAVIRDLAISSEMASRDYLERQIFLTNEVTNRLIELKSLEVLVLVHRGLYDTQAFLSAYVKAGLVPSARASPQIKAWKESAKRLINLVILVKVPVEVAFERMKKKFSTLYQLPDRDAVLNREFFKILDQVYTDLERELPSGSIVVDGSKPVEKNIGKILVEGIDLLIAQTELEEGSTTWKKGNQKVKRQRQTINNANASLA